MANTNGFPEINILLVDDDSISLSILTKVLKRMNYHVLAFKSPLDALFTLRMRKRSFDLVLTDVHMPEMSGLELLKIVDEEFNLPIVLMSADKNVDIMMKGLEDGAAFYLVKPISTNYLSRLWQYAIPLDSTNKSSDTSSNTTKAPTSMGMPPTTTRPSSALRIHDQRPMLQVNNNNNNFNNFMSLANNQFKANAQLFFTNNPLKRPTLVELGMGDSFTNKKPKLVWTTSLHNLFLEAVNKLGVDKAVPKKILEYMDVPGLKRENVASHLQKYRMFLKRIQDATKSMQDGILNNWNERPFRSSFVLNEITFLTNNLHQQYLELLAHAQGKLNNANFFEKGQGGTQVMNSSAEAINPTNRIIPANHIQLPTLNGGQQGLSTPFNFEQGQSSRAIANISNPTIANLQPTTNNYVGLRISANGELISPLNNKSSTPIFNNGATNVIANNMNGSNYANNIGEVNYGVNCGYNHNSFGNNSNAPLVDDIFGVGDMNAYILDSSATQRENPFRVASPCLSNMQGIGDELRQLGIDIQFDQETFVNDFGIRSYNVQGDNSGSLFERVDQGLTSNDDISFERYFAEEMFNQDQENGGPNSTSPN